MSRTVGSAELVTLGALPGRFWFGAWRDVNIMVWGGTACLECVELIERTNVERTHAHPAGLTTVHVITPNASAPSAAVRKALNDMHAQWGRTVACGSVVIERGGLAGLAIRSAITTMTIVAPKSYRVKVFETVDDAAPWIADQHTRATRQDLPAAELLEALQKARGADPELQ